MFADSKSLNDFLQIQEVLQPTLAIEVGSYDADFSKAIRDRNIPVYAFEASPDVYERFKNDMEGISYINKAITDYDGYVTFNIQNKNQAASVGHNGIKSGRWKTDSFVDVPCSSLDSYFASTENEKIALWIDCEGANKEVLEGGQRILSMTESIFIEVEHVQLWANIWTRSEVVHFLDIKGFALVNEYPAYPNQTNCVFVKKDLLNKLG